MMIISWLLDRHTNANICCSTKQNKTKKARPEYKWLAAIADDDDDDAVKNSAHTKCDDSISTL